MPKLKKINNNSSIFLSYFIPVFLCILAGFDFADDGSIDKTIVGAIFVIAMGALGYRIDGFVEETNKRVNHVYDGSDRRDKEDDSKPTKDDII